jgi:hypothetical protein
MRSDYHACQVAETTAGKNQRAISLSEIPVSLSVIPFWPSGRAGEISESRFSLHSFRFGVPETRLHFS